MAPKDTDATMMVVDDDANSPFFCPIVHETQTGVTLSIKNEPKQYSPTALSGYLTRIKGCSPMSRKRIAVCDLILHQPQSTIGTSLTSLIEQNLVAKDFVGAATTLLSAGLHIDTPLFMRPDLLPYCKYISGNGPLSLSRPARLKLTLLAFSLICEHYDMAEKLVQRFNACVNCSWGRNNLLGEAWGNDVATLTSGETRSMLNKRIIDDEDTYSRMSCLSLALDETVTNVSEQRIEWLMQHYAMVKPMHMQQAVTLSLASQALKMQTLLLQYPGVQANYMSYGSSESTFDNIIYRVVENQLSTATDEAASCVAAMALRILNDSHGVSLSSLCGYGAAVVKQFHWMQHNPFRTTAWVPLLERLLDMGATVDVEMLQYALGPLPGERGFPLQQTTSDYHQWANSSARWPDEVVLAFCHSVSRGVVANSSKLLIRAVMYARAPAVIVALLQAGAAHYDCYNDMTATHWAEVLNQQDTLSRFAGLLPGPSRDVSPRSPSYIDMSTAPMWEIYTGGGNEL